MCSVLQRHLGHAIALAGTCVAVGLGTAAASSARSCGIVTQSPLIRYRTTILKGSPPCGQVRQTIKHYAHPKSSYNWRGGARSCGVGIYAHHWKCGPLEHGIFECWHGGDRKGFHARQRFKAEPV